METELATRPLPWVQENHPPHEKLFTQSRDGANRDLRMQKSWALKLGKIVVKTEDWGLILVLLVNETFKTKIEFNGREYASADEMPVAVRVAYERAFHETPALHSGARLAAKLKAKIILNDTEFNHAGEMSVDDRHLYHEALEAVFPPGIVVSTAEARSVTETRKVTQRKMLLVVFLVSVLAGAVYLWLHGLFG
jgi:hypothetical protein